MSGKNRRAAVQKIRGAVLERFGAQFRRTIRFVLGPVASAIR